MAFGQILRSMRLVKVVFAAKQSYLESSHVCRYASTATTMTTNRAPSKLAIAQLPIHGPISSLTAETLTTSRGNSKERDRPFVTSRQSVAQSLSSRLITDFVLPGIDFAGRPIYTTPLGYWRSPVQHRIIIERPPPLVNDTVRQDPAVNDKVVHEPPNRHVYEKQAARLIKIRRKKMKKHKLRKLRKKMFFVWAKQRQRREGRKEKEFQMSQLTRMKLAEEFDAEAWVQEFLRKATTDPATLIKKPIRPQRPTKYNLG